MPPKNPKSASTGTSLNRWYLAYGSNLSYETFQKRRGIRPLSKTSVLVPSLELAFNLPGIPYFEPCFANVRQRDSSSTSASTPALIGVAYLVTPQDYAKILASEGGGASYEEVTVECYRLPENDFEDAEGEKSELGQEIVAYTLLAPARKLRSTPLQPSKRYIDIIRLGARENKLPAKYIAYLDTIKFYELKGLRKTVGAMLFIVTWVPLLLPVLLLVKIFANPKTGRVPRWLSGLLDASFSAMWRNYETVWKGLFGSGETTEKDLSVSHDPKEVKTKYLNFEGPPTIKKETPAHANFYWI
ncbi:hypothetical protein K439DRAFT_415936 [Ramaria rubella]|nr:hypothetical protein K439DRAFT_415936 [Ramaria rubella]